MNGLQTVAHIGKRSRDDNAHGVFQERRLHLFAQVGTANGRTLAAIRSFDNLSVGGRHVDEHRLRELFFRYRRADGRSGGIFLRFLFLGFSLSILNASSRSGCSPSGGVMSLFSAIRILSRFQAKSP